MGPLLRLRAPAKVNLGLTVGKLRPDGFHDIITVMVPLDLHDTVAVCRADSGIAVSSDSRMVPEGPANIAYRAAEAFFAESGIEAGCRIAIRKRIPVGGGLGGGSSDAAAVVTGLNWLFDRPLSGPRVLRIGLALGSDVPFFFRCRAQAARGRGECFQAVRLPRLHVLLCFPGFPVSTAWAYKALDRARQSRRHLTPAALSPKMLSASLRRRELDKAAALVANDFEPVVFRRYPALRRAKELLLEHGAFAAALSGSGSTVYGLVHAHGWKDPMAALARHGFHCIKTITV